MRRTRDGCRPAAIQGSNHDRTRTQTLTVAHTLYAMDGYASVSMHERATRMGFSAQANYHYFPSKEAMCPALHR